MVWPMTTASAGASKASPKSSIRETLISIIISFAMAFVFRGFVIEAFLIPTGSMAPTLLGANMRWQGTKTGYSWPTDTRDRVGAEPFPIQGTQKKLEVHDPMSGIMQSDKNVPVRWGDRIFVMKYLYSVYEPQRFDVVVFKNPTDPTQNYIKRLIGLPGEQVALVDGDVFTRIPAGPDEPGNPWLLSGWTVARKPERAQRAMWQDVFTSELAPQGAGSVSLPWRAGPGSDPAAWEIGTRTSYRYTGAGETTLAWDGLVRPIEDYYPYNELSVSADRPRYPVSDIRISLGVRPERADLGVSAIIASRGHEFRADVAGTSVTLRMKRYGGPKRDPNSPSMVDNPPGEWVELAKGTLAAPLAPGLVTNLDFWHADQHLTLFVNDVEVASAGYTWSPAERIAFATETTAQGAVEQGSASLIATSYSIPEVRWEFTGGPFDLYRVALQRDIFYRPDVYVSPNPPQPRHSQSGRPARATHPSNTPVLTSTQYFMCGDNSPSSSDGRLWDKPSPWVAAETDDDAIGVVHRDLIIGKAFWVYFPAPTRRQGMPVPDFGRMRFIW